MQFITFSGVDGSGKSTQLALLREQLEHAGKKVAYFHAVDFSLAGQLERIKNRESRIGNQANQGTGKSKISASWYGILLRKIFLIIDMFRFRFYFAKLRREGCDYILSDRYFFDTIINIQYLETNNHQQPTIDNNAVSPLLSAICYLLSAPSVAFYFDADPEAIMRRDRAPEQGIDYLRIKRKLFKQKLSAWNMIPIDANRDKDVILEEIIRSL